MTKDSRDSSQQTAPQDFELTPEQENAVIDEEIRIAAQNPDDIDGFCGVCCCAPCCCSQMTDEAQAERLERQGEETEDEALNTLLERTHL